MGHNCSLYHHYCKSCQRMTRLNTDFVGSNNTINICLILSTIYSFIPMSVCVGRGPQCTTLHGGPKCREDGPAQECGVL